MRPRLAILAFSALAWGVPAPAPAQPDPDGFEWVTITHPNNPAYAGTDPYGYVTGRGSVAYEYRIARSEVTTAQWMSFFNQFLGTTTPPPWMHVPIDWGATVDASYPGPGVRYRLRGVSGAAMIPAYGVTWRTAAMYCNWLHNGRSADPAGLLSGAYDVSTFHDNPDGTFTDQVTRSPGARYYIPSLDEWLKAAHWSPANPDNGGWFTYSNASDLPLTYGPPPAFGGDGTGQANAGFTLPNFRQYDIPLGSYPTTPSVWGLLDVAGCGGEWTEELFDGQYRIFQGSHAGGVIGPDAVWGLAGAQRPGSLSGDFGLRVASSVATPASCGILGLYLVCARVMSRRRSHHATRRTDSDRGVRGGGGSTRSR